MSSVLRVRYHARYAARDGRAFRLLRKVSFPTLSTVVSASLKQNSISRSKKLQKLFASSEVIHILSRYLCRGRQTRCGSTCVFDVSKSRTFVTTSSTPPPPAWPNTGAATCNAKSWTNACSSSVATLHVGRPHHPRLRRRTRAAHLRRHERDHEGGDYSGYGVGEVTD